MRRDAVVVAEMIEAAERIIELVGTQSASALEADRERREAILWNFTVLGEAAGQVSDAVKSEHPELGWADPVRLRNRIVHGYWSVDFDVLVATAQDDLPAMLDDLRAILGDLDA